MPLPTATVTGTFSFADGGFLDEAKVIFRLAGSGINAKGIDSAERGIVVTEPIEVAAQFDRFEVKLWPNARGTAATYYEVTIEYTRFGKQFTRSLGNITVPENGGDLTDLLVASADAKVVGSIVSLLSREEYDAAVLAKSDAEAALFEAKVIQDDVNSKLPSPINGVILDTETSQTAKNKTISRVDNDLRMTDGEPDHRIKTFAGLSGLTASKVAVGDLIEVVGLGVYERVDDSAIGTGLIDYTSSGGIKLRRLPSSRIDDTPNLKVKDFAALSSPAILQAAAVSDVVEVAETGHRFVKEGGAFEPLEGPEHTISLAQYDIDRTGNLDVSDFLRRAADRADTLGGGTIILPPARLLVGDVELPGNVTLRGMGSSIYDYAGAFGRTALVRRPDASATLLFRDQVLFIRDMDFDGNGGQSAGAGHGLECEGSLRVEVQNVKLIGHDHAIHGGLSNPVGGLDVRFCVLRNNNVGVNNCKDSFLLRNTFSANRERGLYLNGGQITVQTCFLEFQRGGANLDERSDAIFLGRNANEVLIEGTTFDRNTGYDIFGEEATVNGRREFPRYINMVGNIHKGGAWGKDISPGARRAIHFQNGDLINITPAMGQTRTSQPSPSKGAPSPLFYADLGSATNVMIDDAGLSGITSMIEFDGPLGEIYEWAESNISGEWYVRDNGVYGAGGNPYLDNPNFVAVGGVDLARGTLGALLNNQFAYGDNDTLGYNTLYIRISTGNPTGQDPTMAFTGDPIKHTSGLVSYGGYRSVIPAQTIAAGASTEVTLNGRDMSRSTFACDAIELNLIARRSGGTNVEMIASANIMVRRNDGIAGTATLDSTTVKSGVLTVGKVGSGSDLEISVVRTSRLGKTVTVRIANMTTQSMKIGGGTR